MCCSGGVQAAAWWHDEGVMQVAVALLCECCTGNSGPILHAMGQPMPRTDNYSPELVSLLCQCSVQLQAVQLHTVSQLHCYWQQHPCALQAAVACQWHVVWSQHLMLCRFNMVLSQPSACSSSPRLPPDGTPTSSTCLGHRPTVKQSCKAPDVPTQVPMLKLYVPLCEQLVARLCCATVPQHLTGEYPCLLCLPLLLQMALLPPAWASSTASHCSSSRCPQCCCWARWQPH